MGMKDTLAKLEGIQMTSLPDILQDLVASHERLNELSKEFKAEQERYTFNLLPKATDYLLKHWSRAELVKAKFLNF